mgnify:CR=1 FL=1
MKLSIIIPVYNEINYLERFTKKHNWPATLATISGLELVVRENTDQLSPFAVEKFTIGYRMPIHMHRQSFQHFSQVPQQKCRITCWCVSSLLCSVPPTFSKLSGFTYS